jgi:PAS domain-containing protein
MSPGSNLHVTPTEPSPHSPESDSRRKLLRTLFIHHDMEAVDRYLALAGNLSYGIFQFNSFDRFIDINQALVAILDFETKDQLTAVNLMGDIIQDGDKLAQLLGQTDELDPLEVEWQRKDGKT